MNIIDKIMNALSLYDEEEIIEEEVACLLGLGRLLLHFFLDDFFLVIKT